MSDVVYRTGEQFRLGVAHEFAHRCVYTEETPAFGLDLDLADAADLEHSAERRFALAKSGFGAFEARDVGACRDQPDDFAIFPLRLEAEMQELQLADPVGCFGFEFYRLAGEALARIRFDDREELVVDHLRYVCRSLRRAKHQEP